MCVRPWFMGKTINVNEAGMRLAFCVLADNALPGGAAKAAEAANPALAAAMVPPKRKIKRAPAPNGSALRGGGMAGAYTRPLLSST